jgi:hypothetical protein
MTMDIRRGVAVVPLAVLSALLAHQVRFGDDHAMGGEGNESLVGFVVLTLIGLALGALWLIAREVRTCASGSLLARRLLDVLPGRGNIIATTAAITASALAVYFGVERLESCCPVQGLVPDLVVPVALMLVVSLGLALAVRNLALALADLGVALVRLIAALLSPIEPVAVLAPVTTRRALHTGHLGRESRLGRAPPQR